MSEQTIPLYSGASENFRWAGFGSGAGTNLQQCARIKPPALVFSDRPEAPLLEIPEFVDAFQLIISGYSFCGSWKAARGNVEKETEYKKKTEEFNYWVLRNLKQYETQHGPLDLIVLGGYMRIITEPLLGAYQDKIINVHPADLSVLTAEKFTEEKKRKYLGANAVRDALLAGDASTRSSVILVDGEMDHGEILTQGPEVHFDGEAFSACSSLEIYAHIHQQQQKELSDWQALTTAFRFIAQGRLALGIEKKHFDEWRGVYLDGNPLPYEGYQINEVQGYGHN